MSGLFNKVASSLRGGGCGSIKIIPNSEVDFKADIYDIENFITRFDSVVQIIHTKVDDAANQSEAQEIMIAIQWFIFLEENIYKLIKNAQKVMKSYNLIIDGILKLLKSCLIYVRTDSFKCLFILRTTSSLSKVIFIFHMRKGQRLMNCDTQKQFLDICDELKQQIEIEKNDVIQTQLEIYLFLTKTSFQVAPKDGKDRDDNLNGCLNGIFNSIFDMKPNNELFMQLYRACLHYNNYAIQKNRKQYEDYCLIDMLQWEIINNLKNEGQLNLEEIILQIEKIHEKLVKNSNKWKNHFLWIQMIGKIIIYGPLITYKKIKSADYSKNHQNYQAKLWKYNIQIELIEQMNEFQICQQLKYIMRILEQILSYAIQDVKDNRNEPDESIMLQQEIELIWKKLQNLKLTDKQFSFVNRFKQKLLALPSAILDQKIFQKMLNACQNLLNKLKNKPNSQKFYYFKRITQFNTFKVY